MDTLSPRPKIVSIYNCPACKEVIYKVVRKGSKLRPGYWCHIYCPHCSVRLSPNQAAKSYGLAAIVIFLIGIALNPELRWLRTLLVVVPSVLLVVNFIRYVCIMTKGHRRSIESQDCGNISSERDLLVVTSAAELQNKVMTQRAKGLHPSPCNGRHIVAHCAS